MREKIHEKVKGVSHENEHINITKNWISDIPVRCHLHVWLGLVVFMEGSARDQSVWMGCPAWILGLYLGIIFTARNVHRRHRSSPSRQSRTPCNLAFHSAACGFYSLANRWHNASNDPSTLRDWWWLDHVVFPRIDLALGK